MILLLILLGTSILGIVSFLVLRGNLTKYAPIGWVVFGASVLATLICGQVGLFK